MAYEDELSILINKIKESISAFEGQGRNARWYDSVTSTNIPLLIADFIDRNIVPVNEIDIKRAHSEVARTLSRERFLSRNIKEVHRRRFPGSTTDKVDYVIKPSLKRARSRRTVDPIPNKKKTPSFKPFDYDVIWETNQRTRFERISNVIKNEYIHYHYGNNPGINQLQRTLASALTKNQYEQFGISRAIERSKELLFERLYYNRLDVISRDPRTGELFSLQRKATPIRTSYRSGRIPKRRLPRNYWHLKPGETGRGTYDYTRNEYILSEALNRDTSIIIGPKLDKHRFGQIRAAHNISRERKDALIANMESRLIREGVVADITPGFDVPIPDDIYVIWNAGRKPTLEDLKRMNIRQREQALRLRKTISALDILHSVGKYNFIPESVYAERYYSVRSSNDFPWGSYISPSYTHEMDMRWETSRQARETFANRFPGTKYPNTWTGINTYNPVFAELVGGQNEIRFYTKGGLVQEGSSLKASTFSKRAGKNPFTTGTARKAVDRRMFSEAVPMFLDIETLRGTKENVIWSIAYGYGKEPSSFKENIIRWEDVYRQLFGKEADISSPIAAANAKDRLIREVLQTYADPKTGRIPKNIEIAINSWLKDKGIPFKDVVRRLYTSARKQTSGFEKGLLLVGHNIERFDIPILKEIAQKTIDWYTPNEAKDIKNVLRLSNMLDQATSIDTLNMARSPAFLRILESSPAIGEKTGRELNEVASLLGISYDPSKLHRSVEDVRLNAKVFYEMVKRQFSPHEKVGRPTDGMRIKRYDVKEVFTGKVVGKRGYAIEHLRRAQSVISGEEAINAGDIVLKSSIYLKDVNANYPVTIKTLQEDFEKGLTSFESNFTGRLTSNTRQYKRFVRFLSKTEKGRDLLYRIIDSGDPALIKKMFNRAIYYLDFVSNKKGDYAGLANFIESVAPKAIKRAGGSQIYAEEMAIKAASAKITGRTLGPLLRNKAGLINEIATNFSAKMILPMFKIAGIDVKGMDELESEAQDIIQSRALNVIESMKELEDNVTTRIIGKIPNQELAMSLSEEEARMAARGIIGRAFFETLEHRTLPPWILPKNLGVDAFNDILMGARNELIGEIKDIGRSTYNLGNPNGIYSALRFVQERLEASPIESEKARGAILKEWIGNYFGPTRAYENVDIDFKRLKNIAEALGVENVANMTENEIRTEMGRIFGSTISRSEEWRASRLGTVYNQLYSKFARIAEPRAAGEVMDKEGHRIFVSGKYKEVKSQFKKISLPFTFEQIHYMGDDEIYNYIKSNKNFFFDTGIDPIELFDSMSVNVRNIVNKIMNEEIQSGERDMLIFKSKLMRTVKKLGMNPHPNQLRAFFEELENITPVTGVTPEKLFDRFGIDIRPALEQIAYENVLDIEKLDTSRLASLVDESDLIYPTDIKASHAVDKTIYYANVEDQLATIAREGVQSIISPPEGSINDITGSKENKLINILTDMNEFKQQNKDIYLPSLWRKNFVKLIKNNIDNVEGIDPETKLQIIKFMERNSETAYRTFIPMMIDKNIDMFDILPVKDFSAVNPHVEEIIKNENKEEIIRGIIRGKYDSNTRKQLAQRLMLRYKGGESKSKEMVVDFLRFTEAVREPSIEELKEADIALQEKTASILKSTIEEIPSINYDVPEIRTLKGKRVLIRAIKGIETESGVPVIVQDEEGYYSLQLLMRQKNKKGQLIETLRPLSGKLKEDIISNIYVTKGNEIIMQNAYGTAAEEGLVDVSRTYGIDEDVALSKTTADEIIKRIESNPVFAPARAEAIREITGMGMGVEQEAAGVGGMGGGGEPPKITASMPTAPGPEIPRGESALQREAVESFSEKARGLYNEARTKLKNSSGMTKVLLAAAAAFGALQLGRHFSTMDHEDNRPAMGGSPLGSPSMPQDLRYMTVPPSMKLAMGKTGYTINVNGMLPGNYSTSELQDFFHSITGGANINIYDNRGELTDSDIDRLLEGAI